MEGERIAPDPRYMKKLFLVGALVYGILALGVIILVALVFSANNVDWSGKPGLVFFGVFGGISAITWLLLGFLIPPYFRSISYHLTDSEIVVHRGIVTKVVKTIPYRTVTNIVESRDLLDRYAVSLGCIKIQTAGKSGEAGYEASLAGLSNWDRAHQMILARLRAFRSGMAATAAEVEDTSGSAELLRAILVELKAIRASLGGKAESY